MAELLTVQEVAHLLKLSDRTVYAMCRSDRLPGISKVGGKWRVDREKLIVWLESGGEVEKGARRRHG
ncbi:helix-turn-helix domain-containing protein [Thiocystis violacea]|uniref:helix-turn-helix domain-containing protein n=1 Tax=Thiocystis violacea TaxID=13725 RepID=UPI001906F779|nr:hypothetical protein [Thiocystis violacea]